MMPTLAETYTRDKPLLVPIDEKTYLELFLDALSPATGGNSTALEILRYTARVGGVDHVAWELQGRESDAELKAHALKWWEQRQGAVAGGIREGNGEHGSSGEPG
jgi:hypothetical protein